MSCEFIDKNNNIKLATRESLINIYNYTSSFENINSNIYIPGDGDPIFSDKFKTKYEDIINQDLNIDDINSTGIDNLITYDPVSGSVYKNCAIVSSLPWFTSNEDNSKCEIVQNIELDNKLEFNSDKSKLVLNLRSKDKSKTAFCPYASNIPKAYCENKWYDWIITPNYYLGNTYFKDTSKFTELDVYKCYKPCEGDYMPYTSPKSELKCIPKELFGSGIFSTKYMFSPIGLINLIGNIAFNSSTPGTNMLQILYELISTYNINEYVDATIYVVENRSEIYTSDNKTKDIAAIEGEIIKCINDNILNIITPGNNQDYNNINDFTYKHFQFTENDSDMYTINGLIASKILIPPILVHTWMLANLFQPLNTDILSMFNTPSINIITTSGNTQPTSTAINDSSFNTIKSGLLYDLLLAKFNNNAIKAERLKNIFFKAVNICYDNKTTFSANIIQHTKEAFKHEAIIKYINENSNINTYLPIYNIFITSEATIRNYFNDTNDFIINHTFYKDADFNILKNLITGQLPINIIIKSAILSDTTIYNYFFSNETNEKRTCPKNQEYDNEIGSCIPKKKIDDVIINKSGDFDDDFKIPDLSNIFAIFVQIIIVIVILYLIYTFYDIFGETILRIYNFVVMYLYYFKSSGEIFIINRMYSSDDPDKAIQRILTQKQILDEELKNIKTKSSKIEEYITFNGKA